MIDPNRPPPPK